MRKINVTISVPVDVAKNIKALAIKEDRTISGMYLHLINRGLTK